jgi:acetone carboxylase gamma subunit
MRMAKYTIARITQLRKLMLRWQNWTERIGTMDHQTDDDLRQLVADVKESFSDMFENLVLPMGKQLIVKNIMDMQVRIGNIEQQISGLRDDVRDIQKGIK